MVAHLLRARRARPDRGRGRQGERLRLATPSSGKGDVHGGGGRRVRRLASSSSRPTIAVVTNIDPEHLDHWKTAAALRQGFVDFVNRVPFYGLVDPLPRPPQRAGAPAPRSEKRFVTYGSAPQADYRGARDTRRSGRTGRFDAFRRRGAAGRVRGAAWSGATTRSTRWRSSPSADEMDIPVDGDARGARRVRRRAAPLHGPRRGGRGHGGGRLRAPPGRGAGPPCAGARRGVRPAAGGGVPAAPVHAAPATSCPSSRPPSTTPTC